jgi:antibiotic biosynthesis monooxygenase (ABM) superfamily enzyme
MQNNSELKPKKWKMILISWLFVYPVINLMFLLVFPLLTEMHQLLKTLVFTLILVPIMAIVIPKLHQKFWKWIVK